MVVQNEKAISICEKIISNESFAAGAGEETLTLEETLGFAKIALEGNCKMDSEPDSDIFHKWLRWVQSDDARAILWWHWVTKKKKTDEIGDRDEYILKLWHSIDDEGAPNSEAKKEVEDQITDWSYYQNYFFKWFLKRFHIRFAREVFTRNCFIVSAHYWYFLLNLFIAIFYYFRPNLFTYEYVAGLLMLTIIPVGTLIITHFASNMKIGNFIHSMVPRLFATIAIGYLFLISIPNFVKRVYLVFNDFALFIAGILIILTIFLFILLNIYKRVIPELDFSKLLSRSADLLVIAVSYTLFGLYLFEPVIRKSIFNEEQLHFFHPCLGQLFFLASISLAIGVIFQLIWEEKPVTEPL